MSIIVVVQDYYLFANVLIFITFVFVLSLVYSENEPDLNNELEISVSVKQIILC